MGSTQVHLHHPAPICPVSTPKTIRNVCARYTRPRRKKDAYHSLNAFMQVGDPMGPHSEIRLELADDQAYWVHDGKQEPLGLTIDNVFAKYIDPNSKEPVYHPITGFIEVGDPMDSESDELLELADELAYTKTKGKYLPIS